MMNSAYFKNTLCHCTSFIKYYIAGLCKCFQIVGAFNQNSLITCSTDSCKEA